MLKFLRQWTYSKHAAAISSFYLGTALLGNTILAAKSEHGGKKQKVFNGIVTGCYLVDMSATYLFLKAIQKRLESQKVRNVER